MNDTEKRLSALEESFLRHVRENEDALLNIDEECLTFIPVKAKTKMTASVSGGRLILSVGEEKYYVTLTKEENNV